MAAPASPGGSARRGVAEEHYYDRTHRYRKDRDLATAGQARPGTVPEGRSLQVHRGGICGTGCGVNDPGSHRVVGEHGQGELLGKGPGQGIEASRGTVARP